jgi:predicted transcriptional regulator
MSLTFSELVDEIRHLPLEDKLELKEVFDRDLIEARREEIYQNGLEGLRELEAGRLTPTSDIAEHIRRLEAE